MKVPEENERQTIAGEQQCTMYLYLWRGGVIRRRSGAEVEGELANGQRDVEGEVN